MKKSNEFSVNIERIHLQWLHRQLMSSAKAAKAKIDSLQGPQAKDVSQELKEVSEYHSEVERLIQLTGDRLEQGTKDHLGIMTMKEELEEAMELNPEAAVEIRNRLESLPKEEPYRITFDQNTARMVLKMLENDLQKFKQHVIPSYLKREESEFKDPVLNKTYWVNKAHKAVRTLDMLRKKIEEELG